MRSKSPIHGYQFRSRKNLPFSFDLPKRIISTAILDRPGTGFEVCAARLLMANVTLVQLERMAC